MHQSAKSYDNTKHTRTTMSNLEMDWVYSYTTTTTIGLQPFVRDYRARSGNCTGPQILEQSCL